MKRFFSIFVIFLIARSLFPASLCEKNCSPSNYFIPMTFLPQPLDFLIESILALFGSNCTLVTFSETVNEGDGGGWIPGKP